MSKSTKQISVQVETDLYDKIKHQARKLSIEHDRDITSSDIIRVALREFLKNDDLSSFLETRHDD